MNSRMPIHGVGTFNRIVEKPTAADIPSRPSPSLGGHGFLGERQTQVIQRHPQPWFPFYVVSERLLPRMSTFLVTEPFMTSEQLPLAERTKELLAVAHFRQAILLEPRQEEQSIELKGGIAEEFSLEAEPIPYLTLVRNLIEVDRVPAARMLLEALPLHLQDHPSIGRLRTVLAPPTVRRAPKRDTDRSQEYQWLRQEGHKYRGQWVAVDENGLIACATTLQGLRDYLQTVTLIRRPLIHHIK